MSASAVTAFLGVVLCVLLPAQAFAIAGPICAVVTEIVLGGTGRAIATIAVIALGIGGMFGKISWLSAIVVATGIAVVFSSGWIVTTLTGGVAC